MRRFRYDTAQILRMVMLAAGGVLILAAAGKYDKELDKGQKKEAWRQYGRELMAQGGAAVFWQSYPAATGAKEAKEKDCLEESSWVEQLLLWLGGQSPRVRFGGSSIAGSLEGYTGELIMVGINYDKDRTDKPHTCVIERYRKPAGAL